MTSRRAPLAAVPNAVNSPFRSNVAPGSGKRTRAQAGDYRETVYGQPPTKKQIVEVQDGDVENVDPRRRSGVPVAVPDKRDEHNSRWTAYAHPDAFAKKLAAPREKKPAPQQRVEDLTKIKEEAETVRQWKRHYKRQFPHFVFYFESVPDDVRAKATRQFQLLGAREEKFFSRAVTHVVTTRSIPEKPTSTASFGVSKDDYAPPRTVQPSALTSDQRKTTSLLDANLQRRTQHQGYISHDVDARKQQQARGVDILSRARELGIKIWALEKLQRMLQTMFEADPGEPSATQDARGLVTSTKPATRPAKDADLEQLLRNEKINGPADRDMTVAAQDVVQFKGAYLYIHDMDEKTKPVMVRDYPMPQTKDEGKWPQFRNTPAGRCPFLEDPAHTKKLKQQEVDAQRRGKAEAELASQRKQRAASANVTPRALNELEANLNLRRSPRKSVHQAHPGLSKPLDPPKNIPARRQSSAEGMPPLFGSAQQGLRGLPRMIGGEPVASGIQQSNVTSAIRSQIVSSAAISSTAPGLNKRVGDSKEVSALKRKVLERGASVTSNPSMPSSYMNHVRAAINDDNNSCQPPPRAAKRKAQETLGVLHEDDEDNHDYPRPTHRRPPAPRKRKQEQPEPKPGYCENCRDKFDDFEEHIKSRKHKKFALSDENWAELDYLLAKLKRPHKIVH